MDEEPLGTCDRCQRLIGREEGQAAWAALVELGRNLHADDPALWAIQQGSLCLDCIENKQVWAVAQVRKLPET